MSKPLQYQLRVYLDEGRSAAVRADSRRPDLAPLTEILNRHSATLVCQLDAFEDYFGAFDDPLYKWTKVTVQDPALRAKHGGSFAIRIDGNEVYDRLLADALERDLEPLVGGDIIERMSRHDTDPAKNIPIPVEYR